VHGQFELKFFRTQHRHHEVGEQGEGDEPDEDGFHGAGGLEGFTATGIEPGEDEAGHCEAEVDEIVHGVVECCSTAKMPAHHILPS
jgi:hypothetical protein